MLRANRRPVPLSMPYLGFFLLLHREGVTVASPLMSPNVYTLFITLPRTLSSEKPAASRACGLVELYQTIFFRGTYGLRTVLTPKVSLREFRRFRRLMLFEHS